MLSWVGVSQGQAAEMVGVVFVGMIGNVCSKRIKKLRHSGWNVGVSMLVSVRQRFAVVGSVLGLFAFGSRLFSVVLLDERVSNR